MFRVQNANVPPHPAVGMLAMQWSTTGQWAYGSGALIDSQNILTCSHNLVDQAGSQNPGSALQVLFYPGYNTLIPPPVAPPIGGSGVALGVYSLAYLNGQDGWDVGLLRLAAPANINPPIFFQPTVTGNEIIHEDITLTGYTGNSLGEMYEDVDQVAGVAPQVNIMLYTNDTYSGSSGSPVWTYDPIGNIVKQHAIHVAVGGQQLREGILITAQVSIWIQNALQTPTPIAPGFQLVGL